jgi:polysaccharide deacetylase 2 family uncharacterized protein YibQ
VAADDLSTPLGQHSTPRRFSAPFSLATAVAGLLGVMVLTFVGWLALVDDPLGGEPTAVVGLGTSAKVAEATSPAPATPRPEAVARQEPPPPPARAETPAGQSITIIDGSTGRRQEVPIGNTGDARQAAAGDPRLLETSRHGPIPKVAADGTRPADRYARPAAAIKPDTARIAIVIVGLGIGANATSDAITKLPGPVTLAFTPYGADVDRAVGLAREAGHEVLLQVPMEPHDYPDNDPGPQTLLTSLPTEQNIDRLHWMMSRFQGYVGIANYMGARFSATEAAISPVVKEGARRGLIYFEEGALAKSFTGPIAAASNMPFAKSEVAVDAVPTAAEVGKALSKLEASARLNGLAIGVASALPVSITRIAQWAKTLESRGFVLVPISVAAAKPKSS